MADKRIVVPASVAGVGAALVPALAFADEPATVQSAVTGMATTVATDGQAMLVGVIPVLAPLVPVHNTSARATFGSSDARRTVANIQNVTPRRTAAVP